MTLKITCAAVAICFAIGLGVTQSQAQAQESTNLVAEHFDWGVYAESNPTECWAVSSPVEVENTSLSDGRTVTVRRDPTYLITFFRPGAGVSGQLNFTGGYPFAKGSTVTMQVASDEFQLYTDGEWAWALSPEEDKKIVEAMRRGADAILIARSARGNQTKDTFSLRGYTAAVEDAEARCSR
ncbi:hypothetical protein [Parasulfitobacter algicola]|uniref:Invasion associated locus B (IalB) protein n=1 Tax=Parasulfitobacter algicola TaxID=2614809 RepID=A0ABX2IMX7_9RHOB|nr:hypothetical protein [Sulfitobacter algicola]NSX54229.1 hypothetical protein [Sulfitobacter algicola]